MALYIVAEKDDFGTDWAQVRYDAYALGRFDDENKAKAAASKYITDRNVNNALTIAEKRANFECYMVTDKGIYLGLLDGKDWYLSDRKGKPVTDKKYFELEGKTEVAVRPLPGT